MRARRDGNIGRGLFGRFLDAIRVYFTVKQYQKCQKGGNVCHLKLWKEP